MESKSLGAQYRKQTYYAVAGAGLLILCGFSIVEYVRKDATALWTDVATALIVAGSLLVLRFGNDDRMAYRLGSWGAATGLLCLVVTGDGLLYYQLVFPLLAFYFLGRREGVVLVGIFLVVLAGLMSASELGFGNVYRAGNTVRFLVGCLFVAVIGWSYERSRERFHALVATKNEGLQHEKKQLQDALDQVKEKDLKLEQTVSKLKDQTQLMETVFNSMNEGICVVDATGRPLLYNSSAERISGMGVVKSEPGEWAETYGAFYPDKETYIPMDQNPLIRAMRGESTDDFEIFVRNEKRPEGVHVSVTGRPVRNDETGEVKAGVVIFHDITKYKEIEARLEQTITELRDQTQLMETVFDNMDEGVAVSDAEGRSLIFNRSAERIVGMGAVESEPDEWSEIYGAFYPDKETRVPTDQLPLVRALRGEATDDMELFVRNDQNREGTYVSANGRFIPNDDDANGKVKAGVVVFSDITRYKKHEARLQETIDHLRKQAQLMETVFNSVSDGVVVTGKDGEFLFVNPKAESIVGMGSTDIPTDQWGETYGTFYADRKTPVPSEELPLLRAMHGEVTDDVELFIRNRERPEGVCISVSGRPLQDETGTIEGGVIVLRDITGLKTTESELRQTVGRLQEQTQLMETVFNSMDEGIIVGDVNGRQLFRNPSADRISGTRTVRARPSEWAKVYGIFYPDKDTYLSVDENPLVRAMRGHSTDNFEAFVRNEYKPDGVYVSVTGRPLHSNETDEITAGVIVFRDITKAKKTEAQLKQTIAKLRRQTHAMETVFNSISDGVIAADGNGNYTIFNPSAERIMGLGMTDAGPDQWTDRYGIFYPDQVTPVPTHELALVRAIRGEASDEVEMFIRNPRVPEGVYISVSGRPLHDDSDITKGGVIVFRDVTERVLAEEALSQAFAHGRLEIVDTILHNIGNAINSVSTGVGTIHGQLARNELVHRLSALAEAVDAHREDWIGYLKTDPQGQKVLPFILALAKDFAAENAQLTRTVERVENRVAHIVDIIRTQRSFDSGAMARKDIVLQKTITDAVKILQDSIAKRGIEIEIDCENAPREIRTQESKFHQMMVNLVKNAVEAIDELEKSGGHEVKPSIGIRAYVQEDFLVVDVIDNGIGIEEKHSKIIFAAGYTTKKRGSGLGLHSIANFIIGSGGHIQALSSGTGKGTTMRVMLRLASVVLKSKAVEEDTPVDPNPGQSEVDRNAITETPSTPHGSVANHPQ